jgi:hypothetical protein
MNAVMNLLSSIKDEDFFLPRERDVSMELHTYGVAALNS